MNKASILLLPLWFALLTDTVIAQTIPPLINYQGRLVNSNGVAMGTGDYELRFSLWDAAISGAQVWGPQIFNGQTGQGFGPKLPVVQGYFNTMLGPTDMSGAPLTAAFSAASRYIEISVGTNSPILPRQQILSAPYSFVAGGVIEGAITSNMLSPEVVARLNPPARVTGTNVPVGGVALSLHSGAFETLTNGFIDISNLFVTIQTGNRPVWIGLVPSQYHPNVDGGQINIVFPNDGPGGAMAEFEIVRDQTEGITKHLTGIYASGSLNKQLFIPPGAITSIDTPGAGTHTYKLQVRNREPGAIARIYYCRLMVYEL